MSNRNLNLKYILVTNKCKTFLKKFFQGQVISTISDKKDSGLKSCDYKKKSNLNPEKTALKDFFAAF